MSTRCRIGMELPDGKIKSIYSHWDGYPEGVGEKLQKFYKDPKDVEDLINLGDISSLGEYYDEELSKKDWTKFEITDPKEREDAILAAEKCTVAYKDRGEDCPPRIDEDEEEFISKAGRCCEEWMYLFKKDYSGVYRWHVMETPWFMSLEDKLKGIEY